MPPRTRGATTSKNASSPQKGSYAFKPSARKRGVVEEDDLMSVEGESGEDMDVSVDGEEEDEEPEEEDDEVVSDDENETAPAPSSRKSGNKATKVIEESDEALSRSEEEDAEASEAAEEEDEDLDAEAEEDIEIQDDDDNDDETSEKGVELKTSGTSSRSSITPSPSRKKQLKIKLKLPALSSLSNAGSSRTTPTPEVDLPRQKGKQSRDIDLESEDDDDSSPSEAAAGSSRMTQRQAALAGVVSATEHVSLEEPTSKRKKHLNEAELQLRREETARKRKHLSEKKLEDEKAETINRLLKKQSRARGKRNALATADPDEDGEPDGEEAPAEGSLTPVLPTLQRWISTSKPDQPAFSFSIPVSLMPTPAIAAEYPFTTGPEDAEKILPPPKKEQPICNVPGCGLPRKYKLVKDPTRGGCGMEHLKALQAVLA